MTRTERNTSPAAVMKDRHSRSGLTKNEGTRKGGAGPHNWGSLNEEENLEYQGDMDAQLETAMFDDASEDKTEASDEITSVEPGQEISDSTSSIESRGAPGQRRMSHASEEERSAALRYREGGMKQNGIDLASIARTSYGIAQSPPSGDMLSTSPLRSKAGFSAQ